MSTGNDTQTEPKLAAGEQHTGTLNLTGQGNPTDDLEALNDEISRTFGAIHAPDNLAEILARHGWVKADQHRQQVAEQIAVAIDRCVTGLGKTATNTRQEANHADTVYNRDRLLRVARTYDHRIDGLISAATVAREIGAQA